MLTSEDTKQGFPDLYELRKSYESIFENSDKFFSELEKAFYSGYKSSLTRTAI